MRHSWLEGYVQLAHWRPGQTWDVPGALDTLTQTSSTEHPAPSGAVEPARIVALDLLRGYFVLILAAVHLDYVPSVLGYFDGRGLLWVSEAEGFFLISGLVVAMMRRRDLERSGLRRAIGRSWSRALKLYVAVCTLTIAYTVLGRIAAAQGWPGAKGSLDNNNTWYHVVVATLKLRYSYGWADFLTSYVPLFILAPFLVWMMAHRMSVVVVALSVAAYESLSFDVSVWGSYGVFVQWQVYFVIGAIIGYHFSALTTWFASLHTAIRRCLSAIALLLSIALYAAGMITLFRPSAKPRSHLFDDLIFDNRLGMLRPLFAVIMFGGGLVVLSALQRPIMATLGPVLTLFGRNSLYVYLVQSAIIFAIPFFFKPSGLIANTAMDFAVIAVVWLALRKRFLFRIIPR